MGSDDIDIKYLRNLRDFNPRSPHGERLCSAVLTKRPAFISIHAPRMGSDLCGGADVSDIGKFQSTLPAWGATLAATMTFWASW